jgi:hypothetical protein
MGWEGVVHDMIEVTALVLVWRDRQAVTKPASLPTIFTNRPPLPPIAYFSPLKKLSL